MSCPRVVITPGEPAGIGPELVVKLLQHRQQAEVVVIADAELLLSTAHKLQLPLELQPFVAAEQAHSLPTATAKVIDVPLHTAALAGSLDARNSNYVLATLQQAVTGCLNSTFQALITGPVHKGIINEAGVPFTGHTEYLAQLSASQQVVMMLSCQHFKVALVTTHCPLSEVCKQITQPHLKRVIRIVHAELKNKFAIAQPKLFVAGLNPHAGENGHLGKEEVITLIPALHDLKKEGIHCQGPLPADTLFRKENIEQADCFVAMYHDQGLPVLKYAGFGQAVNITLGLPFVRTSVDHGVALDRAGKGSASATSLQAAFDAAIQMAV